MGKCHAAGPCRKAPAVDAGATTPTTAHQGHFYRRQGDISIGAYKALPPNFLLWKVNPSRGWWPSGVPVGAAPFAAWPAPAWQAGEGDYPARVRQPGHAGPLGSSGPNLSRYINSYKNAPCCEPGMLKICHMVSDRHRAGAAERELAVCNARVQMPEVPTNTGISAGSG